MGLRDMCFECIQYWCGKYQVAQVIGLQRERRARLFAQADRLGLGLAAMGTHPWADYLDQRIIDTPHYNRLREELATVLILSITACVLSMRQRRRLQ